ncbi:TolB-like translocation protein [Chitinophaga flava]|uniref:Biopolymer transporter Tol n=1 Tax=Chitinophaga flava TaxID=2259036 RepID=A0A365Y3J0_9BACT|nr:hypothetical protein [Chitinophaga flava]RBL92888.1 hypothetical protein DF182_10015 [Chitinophaga flava]
MKRMLLGSFVLILFSTAILLFQISCKKSADAEPGSNTGGNGSNGSNGSAYTLPPATATTLGGVIVGNGLSVSPTGVLSVNGAGGAATQLNKLAFIKYTPETGEEIWLVNYDGTGQKKVNITLGADQSIINDVRLSPDGKKVFFVVETLYPATPGRRKHDIYGCDVDGSNLKKVYDLPAGNGPSIDLGGAY